MKKWGDSKKWAKLSECCSQLFRKRVIGFVELVGVWRFFFFFSVGRRLVLETVASESTSFLFFLNAILSSWRFSAIVVVNQFLPLPQWWGCFYFWLWEAIFVVILEASWFSYGFLLWFYKLENLLTKAINYMVLLLLLYFCFLFFFSFSEQLKKVMWEISWNKW